MTYSKDVHCEALAHGNKKSRYGLRAFLLGILFATVIFLPFIIYDNGLFLYYGDFNVQQIPFYQLVHDTIRSGNIGWSHHTDLGANIIGSYSFYLIGSPFFWLTLPFPSEAVPYLMGPLLILKTGCMSFTAYIFLRRYTRNKSYAVLGGLLYAFSGFTCFNIFFNHFHEAMIIFPLLLTAVDEMFENNRRGLVALAVFGSCLMNYYFFVGQVVFVIIYWFVKIFAGGYRFKIKNFICLIFESVIGLLATAVITIPAILCIMGNSRIGNTLNGWNALVYDCPQRYLNIFTAYLFPPELPAYPTFTPDSNTKWGSLAGWLPLFSVSGAIAFMTSRKKHWLKKLIPILVLMAFVPILNSSFQLFNQQYYARWMYMLVLMICLATVMALENTQSNSDRLAEEVNPNSFKVRWAPAIGVTTAFTLLLTAAIGFMPVAEESLSGSETIKLGLMDDCFRFWLYCAIALASLVVLIVIMAVFSKKKKILPVVCIIAVGIISVGYTVTEIAMGKSHGYDSKNYMQALVINHEDDFDIPQSDSTRTDFYQMMDNSAMFWKIPTIQTFHSIVPGSVMEFYNDIGINRDVASRPDATDYALRSLTSTRWLIDYTKDSNSFSTTGGATAMPGWKYYDKQSEFDIWENEYYIPMGFSYDSYVSKKDYDSCTDSEKTRLMLKAMVLTDEQTEKYSFAALNKTSSSSFTYTKDQYYKDCKNRKKQSCSSFEYNNTGFTAEIDRTACNQNTLLFFSVPYEDGWSAQVNGKNVDIEKVNVGFMAIEVPANQVCKITFTYNTPGLNAGIIISIAASAVFIIYILLVKNYEKIISAFKAGKSVKQVEQTDSEN